MTVAAAGPRAVSLEINENETVFFSAALPNLTVGFLINKGPSGAGLGPVALAEANKWLNKQTNLFFISLFTRQK